MGNEESETNTLGVMMIGFSPVIRQGLQAIMSKDKGIELIEDSPDPIDSIKRATDRGHNIDVVLAESRNGKPERVQIIRLIKDIFPDIAVLVLTENINDSYVIDAIHAGAGGYIFLWDMTPETLLRSIHRVVEGDAQMTTALLHNAVENLLQNGRKTLAERTTEAAHLTGREVDVLRLMGNGDSNKIIAETLNITLDTTKKHVRNVIDKMQAHSRTHAAIIAAQAGIVGKPVAAVVQD
jgi:DNA-binding NarL/FixJ family response regulator